MNSPTDVSIVKYLQFVVVSTMGYGRAKINVKARILHPQMNQKSKELD